MRLPLAVREELCRVVGPKEFDEIGTAFDNGQIDGLEHSLCPNGCACIYAHIGWEQKAGNRDETHDNYLRLTDLERWILNVEQGDTPYAETPGGRRLTAIWEYLLELADKCGWFQKGVFAGETTRFIDEDAGE